MTLEKFRRDAYAFDTTRRFFALVESLLRTGQLAPAAAAAGMLACVQCEAALENPELRDVGSDFYALHVLMARASGYDIGEDGMWKKSAK